MEKTLVKGLRLLEALALRDGPAGVTELADTLGIVKSNAHRLLQTLVGLGYVRRDPRSGQYELTLKVWEIGSHVFARLDVRRVAAPYMQRLAARTAETVHLSILDDGEVVYVDKIDSPQPVRAYTSIGGRSPAYCVATGKAMLAHQAPEVIRAVARKMKAFTPMTIVAAADLEKELERVRRNGYAINRGEWRDGVGGVAAPIRDSSARVVAAVGLSGPVDRLKPPALREHAQLVVEAAEGISREFGFRGLGAPTTGPRSG